MFNPTVNTKFIRLFGNPLGQSAAAYLHNNVYQALDMDCFYAPYEIEIEDIEHVVKNLKRFHFGGASVTMPFKTVVYKYLDSLDESSRCTEVVNTIVIDGESRLIGHNTDGSGCVKAFETRCGMNIAKHKFLILGAGGAASAVAAALAKSGAKDIKVLNIKEDFALAEKLQSRIEAFYPGRCSVDYMNDKTINKNLADYDVVIHATKVGMYPKSDAVLFNTEWLSPAHTVCDIVYVPAETKLLAEAKARGCTTLSGLWMNINGAIEQMRLWFGIEAPADFMYLAEMNFLRTQGRLKP